MSAAETTAAALATAEASAATGVAAAQIGYRLTTQTLNAQADEAVTVFPLLLLEFTAIAGGFAAYAATDVAWKTAELAVQAEFARAEAQWPSAPRG